MALPVAHCSLALGLTRSVQWRAAAFICLLCLLPDFDFTLVWAFDLPIREYHRTFSHSLVFFVGLTLIWAWLWPRRLRIVTPTAFFLALASHSMLDLLCTADAYDHGVMLFWPLSEVRLGWPVLVPLYGLFAQSPFSLQGAASFTLLELALAWPFWKAGRALAELSAGAVRILAPRSASASAGILGLSAAFIIRRKASSRRDSPPEAES